MLAITRNLIAQTSMNSLLWAAFCMILGFVLMIAEVFIPSGGLIGALALGLLIWSVIQAYMVAPIHALQFLVTIGILMPFVIVFAVRLWPKTPLGKRIFLKPPDLDEEAAEPPIRSGRLDHLVGQLGRALTPLRPSGMVDFDGRRLDGLSEDGLIPPGSLVRAVQVRGSQLIVRLAPNQTLDEGLT